MFVDHSFLGPGNPSMDIEIQGQLLSYLAGVEVLLRKT